MREKIVLLKLKLYLNLFILVYPEHDLSIGDSYGRVGAVHVNQQPPSSCGFNSTFYVLYREYGTSKYSQQSFSDRHVHLTGLNMKTKYAIRLMATNYWWSYDTYSNVKWVSTFEGGWCIFFESLIMSLIWIHNQNSVFFNPMRQP